MLERFESKVEKGDGCWEWKAFRNKLGYGQFGVRDEGVNGIFRSKYAHRVAWSLYRGEIPEGMCVCHTCDNPGCVNPKHLFLGTKKDNTRDMIQKGRHIEGREVAAAKIRGIPLKESTRRKMSEAKRGEKHFRAYPVEIKGVRYPTQTQAAKALGVTRQAVHYWVKYGTI